MEKIHSEQKGAGVIVTLSPSEFWVAKQVARARQIQNERRGAKDRYGYNETDPLKVNINSCAAEMATAKGINQYWTGILGDIHAPDVGLGVQVRQSVSGPSLILHPADSDAHAFVLALGEGDTFDLKGWILGAAGKVQEYWKDPQRTGRFAYFVPQSALRPISDLMVGARGSWRAEGVLGYPQGLKTVCGASNEVFEGPYY